MPQQGTVFRYLRVDADHNVSADAFALTLDDGATWITDVTYIAAVDLPPAVAATQAANPPAAGLTGYWWRILTGPSTPFPLARGRNVIRARLTDNPEIPHFQWVIQVANYE